MFDPRKGPLVHIVGARPNFMKLAPVYTKLQGSFDQVIIHTGQHYDRRMSGDFFELLGLPEPDFNLGVGSGSHAQQTANTMIGLEEVFNKIIPAAVIVYGDINSTVAAALVASKLRLFCIHVEAGLRSRDRGMPEELNRLVTDQLSDLLLTHSREADENLQHEGVDPRRIHFVGNVMIDTLAKMLPLAMERSLSSLRHLPERYALITLHRPSNVDDRSQLERLMMSLDDISQRLPIVFPAHPRTRKKLDEIRYNTKSDALMIIEPMDYLSFVAAQKKATVVVTDSGGVQEETTYLRTPCLTLRTNTERPVTIETGSNTLIGDDPDEIATHVHSVLDGNYKIGGIPEYWDGEASDRILELLRAMS